MNRRFLLAAALCATFTCACSSSGGGSQAQQILPHATPSGAPASPKIAHVVILVQENRSFNNLFATFPGADGTTVGTLHNGDRFTLTQAPLVGAELNHARSGYLTEYDGGKMDGFDQIGYGAEGDQGSAGTYPLRYVDPSQIRPYWFIAQHYALGDRLFQTQGSGSFTAHQDLIAGGTAINATQSLVDFPSQGPWGCDANPVTKTSLLTTQGAYLFNMGPFPCLRYATLADTLDNAHVTWKYYTPPLLLPGSSGYLWNAFDAIHRVRYGPDWRKVVSPETSVFTDIANNTLPAVSWVIPSGYNSDHASPVDTGPQWVASIVNAIGRSPAWNSTAIIVVWDDWGGYYDRVPPAFIDTAGGLGFRVPLLVASPYTKGVGYVSHTQYEFGSIVRFIEQNWGLPSLHTTDARANSIADMFDLTISPRPFVAVPGGQSAQYFRRHRGDGGVPDTQ